MTFGSLTVSAVRAFVGFTHIHSYPYTHTFLDTANP